MEPNGPRIYSGELEKQLIIYHRRPLQIFESNIFSVQTVGYRSVTNSNKGGM